MIMRYEGANSNNFVIEQYKDHDSSISGQATTHGRKGQIKFIGSQNILRLSGGARVELGTARTIGNLDIGVPTLSESEMLKVTFKDSRTQAHGLHFEHSGTNTQVIQMGMYASYPDSTKGDFKITSKISTDAVQDILTIDNSQTLKFHQATTFTDTTVFQGDVTLSGGVTLNTRNISADGTKLDGIESGATADQTGAEIKTAYESESDTNAFTDAEKNVVGNTSGTNTGDQDLTPYATTANPVFTGTVNSSDIVSTGTITSTNTTVSRPIQNDEANDTTPIRTIRRIDQSTYDGLVSASTVDTNTLYIIVA